MMTNTTIMKTLGDRFSYIVDKYPKNTAVVYEDEFLTYEELNIRVNNLCNRLLERQVSKDSRVGIFCERGIDWVASMIAVVRLGATYIPLSNEDPLSLIEKQVSDANIEIVLIEDDKNKLSFVPTMNVKDARENVSNTITYPDVTSSSIAYIMFTSGTTGIPKGVTITHDNILNLTIEPNIINLDANTRILQTSAHTFDTSTFEVWGSLLNGAELVILSKKRLMDLKYVQQAIKNHNINTMWLTAPLFRIAAEQDPQIFKGLSQLAVGGDVVNPVCVDKVLDNCPGITMFNAYGPTECTTFATYYHIEHKTNGEPIPIGKPLNNVFLYILDDNLSPIKQGEIGELYIGGKGVSNGYINRPELNPTTFISNPFGPGKLYKSGDRASEDINGNIHFHGRKDKQVKIRGYRIELSAIESMLESINEVKSAAVCVVTNKIGSKEIYACVTIHEQEEIDSGIIRRKFSDIAPSHITISRIVIAESLPLNKNGKIDYGQITTLFDYETINNNPSIDKTVFFEETKLIEIFQKHTGFEVEDVSTSFFDLGIDSLTAVYLARDINNTLGTTINAVDVLSHSSIIDLAKFLKDSLNNSSSNIVIEKGNNVTSKEDKLIEIFRNHTGFEVKDVSTSFFDLGIDSLTAVYLARDINSTLGTTISAVDILSHSSILELAEFLNTSLGEEVNTVKKESSVKELPILNQQKSLFIEYNLNPNSVKYNVPILIKMKSEVSNEKLSNALNAIVLRHDALRVKFSMSGTEVFQNIVDDISFTVTKLKGSPNLNKLIRPFNLLTDLPFRFVIFEDKDCKWLFMDFHHIVVDGFSLSVIAKDLIDLYDGNQLVNIEHNYATLVEESNLKFHHASEESIKYWENRLRDYTSMNELPTDRLDHFDTSHNNNKFKFIIDEERTANLKKWCKDNKCTIFEGLIEVYSCFLHAITSSSEVVFATPSRDSSSSLSESTVAMLTNTLWVHSKVDRNMSLENHITDLIKNLRESQKHQNAPVNKLYDLIKLNNKEEKNSYKDTLIAYHTFKSMSMELFGFDNHIRPISPSEGMFSLNLQIFDCITHLEAELEYLLDLFEDETIASFCEIFTSILDLLTQQDMPNTYRVSNLIMESMQEQIN
ncbi:hypothetical protein COL60_10315 [Bacillus pseudomycoides]|uniref:non-ribosomal peptide synthetase n=1 Tax=Bacillus pseudomycoides TaxID=64104 RepID=UPI000BF980D2|nr:non-ribosomal peptide synthetase [Bacillus pseudomycoides]PFZ10490.1 hypothetical protein COL60_10315 [Bacillus pseudomycoides]